MNFKVTAGMFCLMLTCPLVSVFAQSPEPLVTIKVATIAPEGSPWAEALNDFKARVDKKTAGRAKVKPFVGGTLGDENETVLACKRGHIQAVGASTGALASQVPEVNVLELPYLFRTAEEVDQIIDKYVGAQFEKYFTDRGYVLAFWSENGYRVFGGKKAIAKVEDLKGQKMRSQENPIHVAWYRALGASPVPIPTTEVLTALQTGVVDGYDQTLLFAFAANMHTASKFMSVSDHIYQPAAVVINKQAFDSWPADIQKAVREAGKEVVPGLREQIRAMTPILIDNLKTAGVTVNVLTPAERAPFEKIAGKVRADYIKTASAGEKTVFAAIEKGLSEIRGAKK